MARAAKVCASPGCTEITTTSTCEQHTPRGWSTGNAGQDRGGRPWRRQRWATFQRDDFTCQHCTHRDDTGKTLECDHADDGTLRTLCTDCHKKRTQHQAADARWGRTPLPPSGADCVGAGV